MLLLGILSSLKIAPKLHSGALIYDYASLSYVFI